MKKIGLYLSCDPNWGGTFQYSLSILQALSQFEDSKQITLFVIYENDSWIRLLNINNSNHFYIPNRNSLRFIFKVWRELGLPIKLWRLLTPIFHPTVKKILELKCDYWLFPSQDSMSFFGNFNSIVSVHDLMHRYETKFPEVGNPKEFRFREYLFKNICEFSYGILADSNLGKKQITESYGEIYSSKINVLKYIIPRYLEDETPDYQIISKLNIDSDYLFYPAQFWKHKNHDHLLIAFSKVLKEHPKLKLVLAGGKKNNYENVVRLCKLLHIESSVIFAGYVTEREILALYNKSLCLVMPTYFGPTNIPPLEAIYLGKKVVYSKIYAYDEFLPSNIVLVKPDDPNDIARGILTSIESNQLDSYHSFILDSKNNFHVTLKAIVTTPLK